MERKDLWVHGPMKHEVAVVRFQGDQAMVADWGLCVVDSRTSTVLWALDGNGKLAGLNLNDAHWLSAPWAVWNLRLTPDASPNDQSEDDETVHMVLCATSGALGQGLDLHALPTGLVVFLFGGAIRVLGRVLGPPQGQCVRVAGSRELIRAGVERVLAVSATEKVVHRQEPAMAAQGIFPQLDPMFDLRDAAAALLALDPPPAARDFLAGLQPPEIENAWFCPEQPKPEDRSSPESLLLSDPFFAAFRT